MPDEIERTIYKLELDGSGYIKGVDALSASTSKLTTEQEKANRALQINKDALSDSASTLNKAKKTLDDYTGTNQKYRSQLEKNVADEQANQQRITKFLTVNQKAYEDATKAAADFAQVAARAGNLQPAPGQGKIIAPTIAPSAITSQLAGAVNVADFIATQEVAEKTKKEFEGLAQSVQIAENRMAQLNSTDDEFKLLAPIVEKGKEALSQYAVATGQAGDKMATFRAQIQQGTNELLLLREEGKQNSKEYKELQSHVAKLTEEYREQRKAITVLSSEYKGLDFAKSAVQAGIAGFEVYTSLSVLAGGASEELEKKTMQLFAAMQLLNSLEELAASVKKGSTIATNVQSIAQTVYTGVVGASTGALKAFRLALLGTGIGAAIILIGLLIANWDKIKEAITGVTHEQEMFNKINKEAADTAGKEATSLKILRAEIESSTVPMKTRLQAIKDLKEQYPDYFAGLTNEQLLTGNVASAYDLAAAAIYRKAKANAAASAIEKNASKELLIMQEDLNDVQDVNNKLRKAAKSAEAADVVLGGDSKKVFLALAKERQKARQDELADIKKQNDFLLGIAVEGAKETVKIDKVKTERAKKAIEDDYEKRKAEILSQIAALAETEFQNEVTIRKSYDAKLNKALIDIEKDKGLTKGERKDLINLTVKLNTGELDKALADYNKKVKDARQKLNDELLSLQDKNIQDQLNLIQDEFDRRAKLIDFNEQKEIDASKEATQKRLEALDLERLLIGEQVYQDAKAAIVTAGEQNVLNITEKFANDRKTLSADIFKSLLDSYQSAISGADLIFTEDEAKAIKSLSDKFNTGKISYDKYQKELTKIQKAADKDRLQGRLIVEQDELAALDRQLAAETDKYSKHYKDLQKQRDDLAGKIASDEITNAAVEDPNKKRKDSITDYANAIGAVADSVIQFWEKANAAESAALDRSIALQEKRVTAAQRIADRGNAQYLKQEEDRLKELNLKRENAARKQLGIDAALQASQILVGITGAIAKIATPGIGIAETIGAIAIIIGSLATGYGLVKSLQGNQPKLAKGDKYVSRGNNPSGIDTIPAWLNEGEAVMPTHRNKAYHPTIAAIYDGTVPAEHLNNFVRNFHSIKGVPQPNYDRIKNVAEMHIGQDGRMSLLISEQNRLIVENNDLQRQTLRAFKTNKVNVNLDQKGFAVTQMEVIEQMEIDKRV